MKPLVTRLVSIAVNNNMPPLESRGANRRILFVSGDASVRSVVSRVLEAQGYGVDAVAHSGHALLLCRTAKFDLLVAELCGPDIPGLALAEQVRRHCPRISVVFLANSGTSRGTDHVLVRPFTSDELARQIHLALNGTTA
jgi:DNA-binding response OmpR family regulator